MKIKFPKNLNKKQIENFFIKIGLKDLVKESKKKISPLIDDRRMHQPQPRFEGFV